ncbi:hypothetical protein GCM10023172_29640 [Hymenobacter ginsengisoli]|uniref:PilZ domain-containing protein n=1 Tax=Hymenobacter ginsengisoli TaxID=1051626 RepID=A0ABP8QK19_9BACT|nr:MULTISPECIES: hypothetical protein [unclassified Hymenobacter]MBO2029780.1 hypothetical protein [Hymenobacter sp. BT559]
MLFRKGRAQRLRRVISLGSREVREGNKLRYGVRVVNLDASPLSEALLLWADVPAPLGIFAGHQPAH